MRYGNKRTHTWEGYKVHVTESCDPETLHVITHVDTTPAHVTDSNHTAAIHQALGQALRVIGRMTLFGNNTMHC